MSSSSQKRRGLCHPVGVQRHQRREEKSPRDHQRNRHQSLLRKTCRGEYSRRGGSGRRSTSRARGVHLDHPRLPPVGSATGEPAVARSVSSHPKGPGRGSAISSAAAAAEPPMEARLVSLGRGSIVWLDHKFNQIGSGSVCHLANRSMSERHESANSRS